VLGALGGGSNFRAPAYYDATLRLLHRTPNSGVFDALVVFSDDQFRLIEADGETTSFGLATRFLTFSTGYRAPLPGGWETETRLTIGPERESFELGEFVNYEESVTGNFRQEVFRSVSDEQKLGWRFGLDLLGGPQRYDLGGFSTVPEDKGEGWTIRPAVYAENTVRAGPIDIITGLRGSVLVLPGIATPFAIDPRLITVSRLTPDTNLIATVGRYSEYPLYRELNPSGLGNPDLTTPWSLQTSLGVQQDFRGGYRLEVTGFYNETYRQVVGHADRFEFTSGPPLPTPTDTGDYGNEGRGRAYGAELLFRVQKDRWAAWISATLARAERKGRTGEGWQPFEFDQTVVLNALATYSLPKQWVLGARLRFGTGNPYYFVTNRAYNLGPRVFVPIFENEFSRLRAFWALDLRVDKTWSFDRWELSFYIDVQGITDPGNTELPGYSYDYATSEPVRSPPPLPAFGLKAAW